ncbi:hypothetical protein A7X67_17115 [Clostridium sp. W14A]|nr:hypothetical protein A7X67_17115 [Clostridium sp. W14A]
MSERKLVYVASPYAGNIEQNVKAAIYYCRYALQCGCDFIAPHLFYPRVLDNSDPSERRIGIQAGLRLLSMADELWVCGSRISEGMKSEIAEAERLGTSIKYISESEIQGGNRMNRYGKMGQNSEETPASGFSLKL